MSTGTSTRSRSCRTRDRSTPAALPRRPPSLSRPPHAAPAPEAPAPAPESPAPRPRRPLRRRRRRLLRPRPRRRLPGRSANRRRRNVANQPEPVRAVAVLADGREEAKGVRAEASTAGSEGTRPTATSGADAFPAGPARASAGRSRLPSPPRPCPENVCRSQATRRWRPPGRPHRVPISRPRRCSSAWRRRARVARRRQLGRRSVRQTPRPRCSTTERVVPQKTHMLLRPAEEDRLVLDRDLERVRSVSPKRFRISIGITIRPSSSRWRMIPVVVSVPCFAWALPSVGPRPSSHCRGARSVSAG